MGNKVDAVTSFDDTLIKQKVESKKAKIFYVSAKSGKGLDEAFDAAVREAMKCNNGSGDKDKKTI